MDYLNLTGSLNKEEQYEKIVQDTEEIINNFRQFSEMMLDKTESQEKTMYTLGKRVIHDRAELFDPFSNPNLNLGSKPVNLF